MKIGISGAQSVGKTTLLSALRSEKVFSDYAVCDEVTRRVRDYGVGINESGSNTTQRLIMNEHIANLVLNENMLTDRTALDGLVYSRYLRDKGNINTETMAYVERVFTRIIGMYDIIFYIKPEFPIDNDGVRSVSVEFRDAIARGFDVAIESGIVTAPVVLLTGSVRERVNTVITTLDKLS